METTWATYGLSLRFLPGGSLACDFHERWKLADQVRIPALHSLGVRLGLEHRFLGASAPLSVQWADLPLISEPGPCHWAFRRSPFECD